jgi:hypothetical protein
MNNTRYSYVAILTMTTGTKLHYRTNVTRINPSVDMKTSTGQTKLCHTHTTFEYIHTLVA